MARSAAWLQISVLERKKERKKERKEEVAAKKQRKKKICVGVKKEEKKKERNSGKHKKNDQSGRVEIDLIKTQLRPACAQVRALARTLGCHMPTAINAVTKNVIARNT